MSLVSNTEAWALLKTLRRVRGGGTELSVTLSPDVGNWVHGLAREQRISEQDVLRAALVLMMQVLNHQPKEPAA